MGNATVSSSGKTQAGTLHSLGGDGWDDYYSNLIALFDSDGNAVAAVVAEFQNSIRPVSGGGYAYGSSQLGGQSQQQDQPRQGAGQAPGGLPLCGDHQQPARSLVKDGNQLWICTVNDSFINNYKAPGIKAHCPPRKER